MGSFSWYASDTNRAIRSDNPFPVYALQPNGEPLLETNYEGYGEFGGQDIYDLVADWNRKYLAEHPEFLVLQHGRVWSDERGDYVDVPPKRVDEFKWYPLFSDLSKSRQEIESEMRENEKYWEYRYIGIDIACYNEQNFSLPFPIKLVEQPVPYFAASASTRDPDQGWGEEDRFEDRAKTVSEIMVSLAMQSAALAAQIIVSSDRDYIDQEEPLNSREDLISRSALLEDILACFERMGKSWESLDDDCKEVWGVIADHNPSAGDLVVRGELMEEVVGLFGMDRAYFGKDLQVFQEAIDMAPRQDALGVEQVIQDAAKRSDGLNDVSTVEQERVL